MKIRYRRIAALAGLALLSAAGLGLALSSGTVQPAALAPTVMSYQGVLTDSGGSPLGGAFTMTFQLYDSEEGLDALWGETQPVTVTGGLFEVYVGSTWPLSETLFEGQERCLGVSVGTEEEMRPRLRVGAVPYAISASGAGTVLVPVQSDGPGDDTAPTGKEAGTEEGRRPETGLMASASYGIPWSVLAAGGTDVASSNYRLEATLGQPLIGGAGSESFRISAGYWSGVGALTGLGHRIYLPLVLRGA